MITPNTVIRFLKTPFSPSQDDLLKFSNKSSQESFMLNNLVFTLNNCLYVREGDKEFLKVEKSIDSLYNCNYIMYQNTNYSDKWFYAFIDSMEYLNPKVTKLYLKLDVYQTFQFDFSLGKSFIERQTIENDYYNTLADVPSVGDLRTIYEYEKTLNGRFFILFNSDPTVENPENSTKYYAKIGNYSMTCYVVVTESADLVADVIQAVSNKGRADRIQACYYAPSVTSYNMVQTIVGHGDLNLTDDLNLVTSIDPNNLYEDINISIPYSPVFKKEISYPYAQLEVVDKITGKYITLDISKFSDPLNPKFRMLSLFTDKTEYKIIPIDYNGVNYSIENALVIQPSSDIPIFNNSYAKYLRDNSGSNLINGVMTLAGTVGSISTGNVAGAIGSFGSIANLVNADNVARKQANQVSNIGGDAQEYLNYSPSIFFRFKTMDTNHMDIARNFWNAFGYPVKKVTSYSNTNQKFNFIKTVNANVISETIPTIFNEELKTIFDKGVTIWNRDYLNYDIT